MNNDSANLKFHDLATFESVDDALKVVERRAKAFTSGQGIRWAIELKLSQRIVGSCGFSWHPEPSIKGAEIGYELASKHWRKGIMSEALSAALRYRFEARELRLVIAQVMLDNTASKGLLEKLGFQHQKIIEKGGFWKGQHHDLEQFLLERDNFVDLQLRFSHRPFATPATTQPKKQGSQPFFRLNFQACTAHG
ncbi:MAG: GNAT family protein [Phormidesmis sp.]